MSHSGLHNRVCGNEVRADMTFIVSDLTFHHISFVILFCQKKIKKIRKSVVWVFLKNTENRRDERHWKYASDLWRWSIGCGNMNLSSCKENAVTVYTVLRRRGTYHYSMIFHGQNLFPLYFCRTVHRLLNHNAHTQNWVYIPFPAIYTQPCCSDIISIVPNGWIHCNVIITIVSLIIDIV